MGREKILFKSEEPKSLADVAAFMRQLADKLETNQVILQQGAQEVVLNIPANVVLELKAEEEDKKGKTKYSLEVEIEWMEGEEAGPVALG